MVINTGFITVEYQVKWQLFFPYHSAKGWNEVIYCLFVGWELLSLQWQVPFSVSLTKSPFPFGAGSELYFFAMHSLAELHCFLTDHWPGNCAPSIVFCLNQRYTALSSWLSSPRNIVFALHPIPKSDISCLNANIFSVFFKSRKWCSLLYHTWSHHHWRDAMIEHPNHLYFIAYQ